MTRSWGRAPDSWGVVASGAVLVVLLGAVTVHLSPDDARFAVWWTPMGVASAVVALCRPRRWPVVVPVMGLAGATANLLGGRDVTTALGFGVVGALEPLVFALLLRAAGGRPCLRDLREVTQFSLAALVAAGFGAVLGTLHVWNLHDADPWDTWRALTASHAAAILVMVPPVLLFTDAGRPGAPTALRRVERVLLPAGTGAVALAIFWPSHDKPVATLLLPALVWAAARFTPLWVTLEVLCLSGAVMALTALGGGPFAELIEADPVLGPSLAQSFLAVAVGVTLPLTVATAQRRLALDEAVGSLAAFEREREVLRAVMDGSESLVVVLDDDGRIARCNHAVEIAAGVGTGDLDGRLFDEVLEEVVGASLDVDEFADAREAGQVRELAWRARHSGQVRELVVAVDRVRGLDGVSFVLLGIDVTSRRSTERLLQQVLDATHGTSIIGTDAEGTITFFNVGAEEMLGYSAEQMRNSTAMGLVHLPAELEERMAARDAEDPMDLLTRRAVESGQGHREDWTYVRADGTHLTVSLRVTAMRDADGQVSGFLGVAEDVTERRRAEEHVRQSLEREREAVAALQEVDRLKTAFVSATSHELRTPLTTILGFAQLLSGGVMGPLADDQRDLVVRIERSGRRLLGLVEDLLTLSRIESEDFELARDAVDLAAVVREARDELDEMLRARSLDVRLLLPDDGRAVVLGDADHLRRAVTNLLTNAVKFTPDGGRVEAAVEVDETHVRVRVRDTGLGVPVDEQDRLFQRFFRASNATSAAIQGTGLGLSIVAAIVEEHGGSISFTSVPGEGTEFTVRLPTGT